MRLTVAFTISGERQSYLKAALDSWAQVRGVKDAHLLFFVEPSPRFPVMEFADWAARTFASTEVVSNPVRLGCLGNTRTAMSMAIEGTDFAVLCEEDITVSADILEYFTWAAQTYRSDPTMATICAHSFRCAYATKHGVCRIPWFSPLCWGTWPDRWTSFIAPGWDGLPGNREAWDTNLRHRIIQNNMASIFPLRSRSLHIGETSTLIGSLELASHFYRQSVTATFNPDYGEQAYSEIPRTPELGLVV